MFKLFKRFRWLDWLFIAVIIGLTILQVYCTMTMTDYIANMVREVNYLGYQKDPASLNLGDSFLQMFETQFNSDWSALASFLEANPTSPLAAYSSIVNSIANASTATLWWNAGVFVGLALAYTACAVVIAIFASMITASFATNLRKSINEKVSSFSLAEINKFSTASLITRSTNDIEQIQMCILLMLRMVFSAPVTAIWAICKIQASSGELTLVTAIAIVFLLLALIIAMILVLPKFKVSQRYVDRLNGITREHISGIRVVHAYNAEGYQEEKFKKANDDMTKLNIFTSRVMCLLSPVMTITMDGVTIGILAVGAYVINSGAIDYATVSAFSSLATQIIMAFMMLLMMFVLWPRASVSAKRINELLATEPSIVDPKEEKPTTEKGSVEFKNVSFIYPDAQTPMLSDISFKVNEGETLAIIGSTGCGKSTLVNLCSRLYDASSGEVLVDGVNVKDLKANTLRSKIGFVPQKATLFSGTIESNLKLGDESLPNERMEKAAEIACASEFISKMDKGYEAPIAQGGTNVSGGQKQRLCIARAVAIDPEILVFDDSFSALDFKTDYAVRENIKKEMPHSTKIIVAQRIGTIMDADTIIVLENGKIVGKGKHKELLQSCPTYKEIALSQLSKEELGL